MTDDRRSKPPTGRNPTFGISIFIVVVVLLVIGTLFFNAIRDKRDYERNNPEPAASAGGVATAASAALGASH
jgi:hypothetical protein